MMCSAKLNMLSCSGSTYGLERLRRAMDISSIAIWMDLQCQTPVGFGDLVKRGCLAHFEDEVVVFSDGRRRHCASDEVPGICACLVHKEVAERRNSFRVLGEAQTGNSCAVTASLRGRYDFRMEWLCCHSCEAGT